MMMMMSLSEMEKIATEDDCVDSGAETGGSDYSPMSSASSGESSTLEGVLLHHHQDPFLVSVHLIADPGQGPSLQRAADAVLSWVHPELQLFRVSERASTSSSSTQRSRLKPRQPNGGLTESYNGDGDGEEEEEQTIATLHRALQRPPWRYHHTEKTVSNGGRRMLPLAPRSQDFFTLGPGTGPLWAARQVHYGKEIVRFTVYCRHESYADMVRLYRLLLQRRVAPQKSKKEDFCFFVTYANPDTEVQLSLKRLPRGQSPVPTEAAVMEVRVRDVGALVPLLPRPCSPISEVRWQTEDYDGNKILLQIQGSRFKSRRQQDANMAATMLSSPSACTESLISGPYVLGCSSAAASSHARNNNNNHRRYRHLQASRTTATTTRHHQNNHAVASLSQASLPLACEEMGEEEEEEEQWDHHHLDSWRSPWRNLRSSSLFSLPGLGNGGSSHSNGSSPVQSSSPAPHNHHHYTSHSLSARCTTTSSHLVPSSSPSFRLNVDALVGAEETDVDTGDTVDSCSSSNVDLTVVSAYVKSSLPPPRRTPPPCPSVASTLEDIGLASPGIISGTAAAVVVKASKMGRPAPTVPKRTSSLSSNSTHARTLPKSRLHPQSTCLNASRSPSLSDVSVSRWDSSNSVSGGGLGEERSFQNKHKEEEDQEFYI